MSVFSDIFTHATNVFDFALSVLLGLGLLGLVWLGWDTMIEKGRGLLKKLLSK